jgi:hypothetical protein
MKGRKTLSKVDGASIFPNVDWPPLPSLDDGRRARQRIFVNEDLTKPRSKVAALARRLKKEEKIDDTWVKDGSIFVKYGETKLTFITLEELESFAAML